MDREIENDRRLLPTGLDAHDLALLRGACAHLEHPSLAARLSSVVGTPIEVGLKLLPKRWYQRVHGTLEAAIGKSLSAALSSLRREHEPSAHDTYYRFLLAGAGAAGGFFGLPGLLVELPVTTTLMLRSIAEIAREAGEDIHRPETQVACLEVFALGGRSELDDAAETGYYGVRLALAAYLRGTALESALLGNTAAAGFLRSVAARFGVDLSKRAAVHMVPVAGAVGGALVNTVFLQHFQDMARSHFTVRRLERKYGEARVKTAYEAMTQTA